MFPNFWTPVLPVANVGSVPIAVELAGESLVLFRSPSGQVAAFVDRCPHRGAPLSRGQITNGCLECPYHGWQFASNGACTHVPFNSLNPAHLAKLSVMSFPVRVIAGMLWIFTGTKTVPEPQLLELRLSIAKKPSAAEEMELIIKKWCVEELSRLRQRLL